MNRDGSIRLDGLDFSSLSSAVNSIVSAKRVNGWAFWRLGSGASESRFSRVPIWIAVGSPCRQQRMVQAIWVPASCRLRSLPASLTGVAALRVEQLDFENSPRFFAGTRPQ